MNPRLHKRVAQEAFRKKGRRQRSVSNVDILQKKINEGGTNVDKKCFFIVIFAARL